MTRKCFQKTVESSFVSKSKNVFDLPKLRFYYYCRGKIVGQYTVWAYAVCFLNKIIYNLLKIGI